MIYAGIDLGGTTIKGALVDEKGQILIFWSLYLRLCRK